MKSKETKRRLNGVPLLLQKNRVDPKLEGELLAKLDQLQGEYLWISDNEKKLRSTHLNKYIAVKDQKVVFDSNDFNSLLAKIRDSNNEVDDFAIKRVTKHAPCLLL